MRSAEYAPVDLPIAQRLLFRACMLFAACLACAAMPLGAQTPKRPAESPQMRQLQQALDLAEHGEKQQALALANTLLEKYPGFVPALKLRGMLLEEAGHGDEASQSYQKALQLSPNDPGLLFKLGVHALAAGDNDQAINLLLRHLRLVPKDGDALFYLAQAYHLQGQNDLALKAIRECSQVEPGNAQVSQKYGELLSSAGDNEAGLRWLLKAQKLDPSLERIDFDIGAANYKNMDFSNAVKYSKKAAEKQPDDASVLTLLAHAEVKLSQWRDAQAVFERILASEKNDLTSLLEVGHCEVELGQYQPAVDTLLHLLQLDPAQTLAHYYLSQAYAGLGKTAEAHHEADLYHTMEQMSFAPPAEDAEVEKGISDQARQLLIEHREDEARQLLQRNVKGPPATSGDAYVLVGALYLSMGDAEAALRNFHHALEIEPAVRGAHTYEGMLALQQDDVEKAGKEFEAEIANNPNYQPAQAELGEVRYRQQRWPDAAELLSKSRTSIPRLIYMQCDSYFHMGKVSDAKLAAETLAAFSKNDQKLMQELIELLSRNHQVELAQRLSSATTP